MQPVVNGDYVDEMDRYTVGSQTYVTKSDPRIKHRYHDDNSVSYKEVGFEKLFFGQIDKILMVRGLVLFCVRKLVVTPEMVPGHPIYF